MQQTVAGDNSEDANSQFSLRGTSVFITTEIIQVKLSMELKSQRQNGDRHETA